MLEGAEFVKDAAEGPDVTFVVVGFFFAELGREIVRGTYNCMRHILCLIQQFCDTQISHFDPILPPQKHIGRLNIPMQYLILVQVPQPQTHLNKELPYLALRQRPVHLLLQVLAQVAIFAVLHDDVDGVALDEGIIVFNNILAVNPRHNSRLKNRFPFLFRIHPARVDHLHHVDAAVFFVFDRVNHAERALPQLLQLFKITLL